MSAVRTTVITAIRARIVVPEVWFSVMGRPYGAAPAVPSGARRAEAADFYGSALRRRADGGAPHRAYGARMPFDDRLRVLVAGGGVGGVETVLAVQALAGERVSVEQLAPDRHFMHRPLSVVEPFRAERPERIPLAAIAADRGVRLHRDAVARVD